jgi:transposase-like protein
MKPILPCCLAGAALLAAPAASHAAPNGLWKGNLYAFGSYKKIDKAGTARFTVKSHRRLRKFKFVDKSYRCINDGFDPTDDTFEYEAFVIKSARIKHGKVHKVVKTDAAKVTLTGRFKGKVAKGKIDFTSYSSGCSKNWFWKAKLRR